MAKPQAPATPGPQSRGFLYSLIFTKQKEIKRKKSRNKKERGKKIKKNPNCVYMYNG